MADTFTIQRALELIIYIYQCIYTLFDLLKTLLIDYLYTNTIAS